MKAITPRQLDVLRFIATRLGADGYPPSMREIGLGLDIRNTNGVSCHLKALEQKGLIERTPLTSRGLRLTSAAARLLEPVRRPSSTVREAR